jgi:hypothetical protein
MIGDTVKLVSAQDSEIVITGRTKHFLSLCGEHLSVDNMNHAIERVEESLNIDIKEFTVTGYAEGTRFLHHWFIGTEDEVSGRELKGLIDEALKTLNDDYCTERDHALSEVRVEVLPPELFYKWMKQKGKEGGQNKFPRVMKEKLFEDWRAFLRMEEVY